jgi:penicillin-binding protein 1A
MKTLLRLVAVIIVASLGLAAVGVAAAPEIARLATANDATALPLPELSPLSQRSIVYDVSGAVIDVFKVENREPFTIDKVPVEVRNAVLAVEDESFYRHKGVNAKSLLRAMLANVSAGEVTQGGSTITQQLVKNALLTDSQTANRKLLEAAYAVRLERQMTKDEILERYLNTVFFGNNAYGLQAAAETYFGKNVDQLTMVEGAFLAGLIRNPVGYDPILRPERSRTRFHVVVDRLIATGMVSKADGDKLATDWPLPDKLQRSNGTQAARSYFTEEVRDQLLNKTTILGDDYQTRYNALFRGGLKIYTTLDPYKQFMLEAAKVQQLPDTQGRFDAASVSLDTKTGAVRAMSGGPGFDKSQVNLATSRRQTGSSIKIFILAAALNAGIQPNDIIDGQETCAFPTGDKDPTKAFYNAKEEAKAEPLGPVERMTYLSINCAYVKLSLMVGLDRVIATANAMGVKKKLLPVISFAAGANEVSPLEMASGMQTIANHGLHFEPYYIERIERPDGKIIYQHQDPGTQVLSPAVADTEINILQKVLTSGTGRRAQLDNGWVGIGKTGTQDQNTNAWFVGATPVLSTAVWMGDPNSYTPMINIPEFAKQGFRNIQGGMYPALIWKAYMDAAHKDVPLEGWPKAPPLKRKPARLFLPGVECAIGQDGKAIKGASPVTTTKRKGREATTTTSTVAGPIDLTSPVVSIPVFSVVYDCAKGAPKPVVKPTTPSSGTTKATTTTASDSGGTDSTSPPGSDKPVATDSKPPSSESPPTSNG